jgi:hypothetical protein
MQWVTDRLGMNPMEDVLAVTLYATQYEGDVGVGLLYVKQVDREKMLAVLREKHPDHQTSEYAGRQLYTWNVKHRRAKMELTGTFASDTLIAIGAGADHVKVALDVLDGQKPGLTGDAPLLQGVTEKALFVARAIDVPDAYRESTKCPVLRQCRAAFARWTEEAGAITADYELTAASAEKAESFQAIVSAAMAMGRLGLGKMESVQKLLDGVQFDAEGDVFWLTWKTTTEDIQAAIREVMSKRGLMGGRRFMGGRRPGR